MRPRGQGEFGGRKFPAAVAVLVGALLAGVATAAPGDGAVAGRVTDEHQDPVEGALVALVPGGPQVATGPDGLFRLEAPPGNYLLRVTAFNRTEERPVVLTAGQDTPADVTVRRDAPPDGAIDPFPFLFLGAAMLAVVVGGFYVNKRMSETGLAFDKSVVGGAPARKPFRRRRRKAPPRSP